ncbi:MAG: hypothetical protein QE278_10060 [Limnobacter sp.]|nr:hypothetical protein [Limnobacter sp.]
MRDIWIIHEVKPARNGREEPTFEVQHCQVDGANWRTEEVMQWQEFVGSHKALSSFSMPDTLVYLGLPPSEKPDSHASQIWMAICDSPSRLAYADVHGMHMALIEQVESMGKDVIVCAWRGAGGQAQAGSLREVFNLISNAERQQIEKWHRKKSVTQTVVNTDWALRISLLLHGKEGWLKSRLSIGVLLIALATAGIHLALEGLRMQGQRLSLQHKQVVKELDKTKPSIEKSTDWEWFVQTLKLIQTGKQTQVANVQNTIGQSTRAHFLSPTGISVENLAVDWDAKGDMHIMLKTGVHKNQINGDKSSNRIPEDCKAGRQGWIVCSNSSNNPANNAATNETTHSFTKGINKLGDDNGE